MLDGVYIHLKPYISITNVSVAMNECNHLYIFFYHFVQLIFIFGENFFQSRDESDFASNIINIYLYTPLQSKYPQQQKKTIFFYLNHIK